MKDEPTGVYIYQPFGGQHKLHWETKRIFAIGGLPPLMTIEGLTKKEAEFFVKVVADLINADGEE